ncbi:response regulator [Candidatus Poribacteria bacterium]|nr:response regulator [Candidatus Poribacteria bacterium]
MEHREIRSGVGSRFFFTLPFSPVTRGRERKQADAQRQVVHLADGYTVKALVADDVKGNRDVLAKILSDIGCDILLAENGQQAVKAVRAYHPDIVLMDIRMPVMDGLAAANRIIEESRGHMSFTRPKMTAISASAFAHERKRALQ